ncbi:MAG TPA: alpha/beta fold hydrolase [Terriglobales bacterium]|nr:alpha/beta fold hydrolase [Terriglobales bacterium]
MKPFVSLGIVCWILTSVGFSQSSTNERKPLTIEAVFGAGGITGRAPENIQWSPDSTKVSFVERDDSGEHGQLWYVDASTGEKRVLVSEGKLATLAPPLEKIRDEREKERLSRYHVAAYEWTPDSKHLLFDSQGQLWLYTLENGTAVQITSAPEPSGDPKFSPDGSKLAYLRQHNLYVRPASGGEERPLTKETGDKDKDENLLNGEVDWVYAEELDVRSNYFWSPDSRHILYLQMDETKVPTYPIVNWLVTHPVVELEKYPKAGDPNPGVRLGLVAADGGKTKWISIPDDQNIYIPRFGWVRDDVVWAEVLNRAQDQLYLYFVDIRSGRSRKLLTESAPDAWVYVNDDFRILKSGDRFTWQSWRDGTTQLYLYSFDKNNPLASDAKLQRQLTQGAFEVLGGNARPHSGLEAIDEEAGVLYFTCDKDDPRERQLYAVKLDGSELRRVSAENGTHAVTFADDGKRYLDERSAILTPPSLSLCQPGGSCHKVWDSHRVDDFGLIPPRFLEFKAEDGTKLYGELIMPAGETGKIPLIVYVYGGPAGQTVRNEWAEDDLFHQILAQKGFAVFTVDNRGTPGRDRKFQTAVRHQYGPVELRDQLTALDQLLAEYLQFDNRRMAIWGWSNGGSMTLYTMTHSERFKAGVSVAPVTDWHNYDSIYTERNNGLPSDKDTTSYVDMDLPRVAEKLHGSLLLVHGTSDDNVHFQNSVQMVEGLIRAGKQFRFMIYPNKTHGIGGAEDREHLYHMMEDHLERELR